MHGRNDDCWCGSRKKWKKCHFPHLPATEPFEETAKRYARQWSIIVKTPQQIVGIREASHLAAKILDEVALLAQEGVTTNQLNEAAHAKIVAAGAVPASLGYGQPPFPKSICTSLNEVICHGIPNDVPLAKGDILNIDVAVVLNGYFGDCGKMVAIGPVSSDRKVVFDTSLQCLQKVASILRPGLLLGQIGAEISTVAEQRGCTVIYQFVGHGVGLRYHESPQVPHARNNSKIPLVAGMTFTVEPMINFGTVELDIDPVDQWTARTKDGKPSAQWEYAFLITPEGAEILTPWTVTSCEEEVTRHTEG